MFNKNKEDKKIDLSLLVLRFRPVIYGLLIFIVAIVVLLILTWIGYLIAKSLLPTPEPPVQTTEQPPKDLKIEVKDNYLIETGDNIYDVGAKIKDPDGRWGTENLSYTFTLSDKAGNKVGSQDGETYILPGQEKFIIRQNISTIRKAENLKVDIKVDNWIKLKEFPKMNTQVKNLDYKLIEDGAGYAKTEGNVVNETNYALSEIELNIILYDKNNNVIGLNYTTVNTIESLEERYFSAIWSSAPKGQIARTEVQPGVNVYNMENFMSIYQEGDEKYKEFQTEDQNADRYRSTEY